MRGALYGIATEGWPFVIALAVIAAWMLHAGSAYAAIPLVGAVMAVLKFRDPQREVPADPHGIVSPVDGQLIEIRPVDGGLQLCFRIAPLGAYLLRSPAEGKVLESARNDGQHGFRIHTDEGQEVELRLHSASWLPAAASVGYGERVGQGKRCGALRGAHLAEVWLPPDAVPQVRIGQRVLAGETVIAHFAGGKDVHSA